MPFGVQCLMIIGLIFKIGSSQASIPTTYDPIVLENKAFCAFCPAIVRWIRSVMWNDPVKSEQEQYIFDVIYEEQCKRLPDEPNIIKTRQFCVSTTQRLIKDHLGDLRKNYLGGEAKWKCFQWYTKEKKC